MKKFKLLITIIFSTFSFNAFALNQKPSIEVFVFGNQNYNHSIKLSISSHLNQNGFITRDGNLLLKKMRQFNVVNFETIIENANILSDVTDAELLLFIKLNHSSLNGKISKVSIASEIYNANTKNFISTWSTPRKILNHSSNCDQICKNSKISEAAILLSDQLGKSITGILNASSIKVKNYNNISKVYNFKLLNFPQNDIFYLTDIMTNQFPGFIKISNEINYGDQSSWSYYSSSQILKLKKWLVIALNEINLNLDKDYELIVSKNSFFIRKFPIFNSRGSKGNPQKFN